MRVFRSLRLLLGAALAGLSCVHAADSSPSLWKKAPADLADAAQHGGPPAGSPAAAKAAARAAAAGSPRSGSLGKSAAALARRLAPVNGVAVQLDRAELGRRLGDVLPEGLGTYAETGTEIDLPLPDGTTQRFLIVESSILSPKLAAQHPELRTFRLQGIDDPAATGSLDFSPAGFRAFVLSPHGQFLVDPCWHDDDETHLSYYRRDYFVAEKSTFGCLVERAATLQQEASLASVAAAAERPTGAQLRTYRLAVACTGEYTAAVSGTTPGTVPQALAAIVTTMNRVSAIYEREFAVRLQLIPNETAIIFTDSVADGFSNDSASALINESQSKIDALIGSANYDIGHTFSTGGGGLAGLGVICRAGQKGRGITGSPQPYGDPYDIDYVAHEVGHQFGGNHTFNGTSSNCSGANRNATTAYEPGSGTTIMAYAGICTPQDLAPNSDDYFHVASYDEIVAYTNTGFGSGCAVLTSTGNTVPAIAAVPARSIPANTPFELVASATDADGDTLTYCWEEFDLGAAQDPTAAPRDNGAAPIFRSFAPKLSSSRVFPSLEYILGNANVPPATIGSFATGEVLPDTNRTMTFRVTVRDNRAGGGATDYVSTTVTSVKTNGGNTFGPFRLSSHNATTTLTAGTPFNVTWDVANSNLAPVSCANVAISLSTDGGVTFPYVLAASVPNNGTASVTIPNLGQYATTQARLKIAAVGNIFFDVNDASLTVSTTHPSPAFTVSSSITARRGTPTPTITVVGTASSSSGSTPLSASVFGAPFGATVTPSIDGAGNVTLTALIACSVTTTNTTRTYPLTVVIADSVGATVAKTVNLVVQPNLAPTAPTYPATATALSRTVTFVPTALSTDTNGNLPAAPYSVFPATLPGGGTIAIDATTGALTVITTGATTVGTTKLYVSARDTCGASAIRELSLAVANSGPAFTSATLGAPTAESAVPANGVVDPGETVTLLLPVKNVGTVATTNLVGTLQATGGVTLPSGLGNYGAIAPGATGSVPFTFLANGSCGGLITATLALQDGAVSYTPVTFTITLGVVSPLADFFAQNFDGVTAPALPSGWVSSILLGSSPGWTTSTSSPNTSPNAVFVTPVASTADKVLVSPSIAIPANAAVLRLTFQHRWNTEATYDGGVLEISVNAGSFVDVTDLGATFLTGGYNDLSKDGPLAGRSMWGGEMNSGYTLTTVDFPASLAGQSVKLRWRQGCDSSATAPGTDVWRIDTIRFQASTVTCASSSAPSFTSAPPPGPLVVGAPYSHTFTATGSPAPTFALTSGTLPGGITLTPAGVLSGTPTSAGTGTYAGLVVTASNSVAPAATQGFSLTVVTRLANYAASFGLAGPNALPLADPDGDGRANALEYAEGTNPALADVGTVLIEPRTYLGTEYMAIEFTRSSVATDLTYIVEGTGDLAAGAWTELARSTAGGVTSGVGFVGETGSAPTFTVEVRDTVSLASAAPPQRFLRLRIEIAP